VDVDESRCGVGNDLPFALAVLIIDAVVVGGGSGGLAAVVVFGEIEFRRRRFMRFRFMLDVRLEDK